MPTQSAAVGEKAAGADPVDKRQMPHVSKNARTNPKLMADQMVSPVPRPTPVVGQPPGVVLEARGQPLGERSDLIGAIGALANKIAALEAKA